MDEFLFFNNFSEIKDSFINFILETITDYLNELLDSTRINVHVYRYRRSRLVGPHKRGRRILPLINIFIL